MDTQEELKAAHKLLTDAIRSARVTKKPNVIVPIYASTQLTTTRVLQSMLTSAGFIALIVLDEVDGHSRERICVDMSRSRPTTSK